APLTSSRGEPTAQVDQPTPAAPVADVVSESARGLRLGVRVFLFLILSMGSVLPLTLLGLTEAKRSAQREIDAADRQALAAARAAAAQLSVAMDAYVHAAEAFSAHIAARHDFSHEALKQALAAHALNHREFLGAYVSDSNGTAILYIRGDGTFSNSRLNYNDRGYFKEARSSGRVAVSEVHRGRFTRKLTVQIAAPMLDSQRQFLGITCSSVDLSHITSEAQRTISTMPQGRLMVVDGLGRVIADSEGSPNADPRDGSKVALFAPLRGVRAELRVGKDPQGTDVRAVVVGLTGIVDSWRVVAMAPQAVAEAQANRVKIQVAILGVSLVAVMLAISFWLAAWLSKPLRALASSAEAVTRGKLDVLPTVVRNAPREMTRLTVAVRSMIVTLRTHAQNLEARVQLRTQELSQALETLRKTEQSIRDDIDKARLFQEQLLPALPNHPEAQLAVCYAPLEQVSGDIYDVVALSERHLRLFVADATGHGIQASMRTILLKSAYDRLKNRHVSPETLMAELNTYLVEEFPEGDLHCAACCVDVHLAEDHAQVIYSNGGNGPLFILAGDTPAREHYSDGPLLGATIVEFPEPAYFRLERGETLLVCTDGLLEQWNAQRQRFDVERLMHFELESNDNASIAASRLMAAFHAFRGTRSMSDDVTALLLHLRPRPSA
ncbi:MAG TPA: SpoIIE family protein phosphatase, partial [Polyangiaceae bacterium]|nr:SpoIIE family protein phosphatase [Polyangiaceae bacterium]